MGDAFLIGPNDLASNSGENPLKPSEAYKKLLALSARTDSDRPELAEAKTFLSN